MPYELCSLVGGYQILKEPAAYIFRVEHGEGQFLQTVGNDLPDWQHSERCTVTSDPVTGPIKVYCVLSADSVKWLLHLCMCQFSPTDVTQIQWSFNKGSMLKLEEVGTYSVSLWGSHRSGYEEFWHLGYNDMWSGES